MASIRKLEQANGTAYTLGRTTVLFRYGNLAPQLVSGTSLVTVDAPERFGPWFTPAERAAWTRRFVAGGVR